MNILMNIPILERPEFFSDLVFEEPVILIDWTTMIIAWLLAVPAALLAIALHGYARDYVLYRFAKANGEEPEKPAFCLRKHLDIIGTLSLIFLGLGWAKPAQMDPEHYENNKGRMVAAALAGLAINFFVALAIIFLTVVARRMFPGFGRNMAYWVKTFLNPFAYKNLGIVVLGVLPVPPLAASGILDLVLSKERYERILKYERYIKPLLALLLLLGLSYPFYYALSIVHSKMEFFWYLIIGY